MLTKCTPYNLSLSLSLSYIITRVALLSLSLFYKPLFFSRTRARARPPGTRPVHVPRGVSAQSRARAHKLTNN